MIHLTSFASSSSVFTLHVNFLFMCDVLYTVRLLSFHVIFLINIKNIFNKNLFSLYAHIWLIYYMILFHLVSPAVHLNSYTFFFLHNSLFISIHVIHNFLYTWFIHFPFRWLYLIWFISTRIFFTHDYYIFMFYLSYFFRIRSQDDHEKLRFLCYPENP